MSVINPVPATVSAPRRGLAIAGIVAVLLLLGIVIEGLVSRAHGHSRAQAWTEAQALPSVKLITPATTGGQAVLQLPGRLQAYMSAPIYARVDGYLKSWKSDIGARVKAGDLLAEIETPDLDQQLIQARASLASAKANAQLAKTTAERWGSMLDSDSVSRQEVDEKSGDLATKSALVNAAQAAVDRLLALKAFARVVAPFDGTVTARSTDVGALITAGGGTRPELFEVSDTRKLRLYVNVPQNYVPAVTAGTKATITVPEHPGKNFLGEVELSANSVNPLSGTTLMQLLVDNRAGELLAGGYANVQLDVSGRAAVLSVPSSALVFDAAGLSLAVLDAHDKVVVRPVTVSRDLGSSVEIGSGISASDRVIDSPPDGLATGASVQIATSNDPVTPAAQGKAHEKS
jgi:RND family efflux transporter MFP subunit